MLNVCNIFIILLYYFPTHMYNYHDNVDFILYKTNGGFCHENFIL